MRITYDVEGNIAYMYFQEVEDIQVETVQIGEEINIDLAPDGTVYGIELMNPNEQVGKYLLVQADKEISVAFKLSPELAETIVIAEDEDREDFDGDEEN